MPDTDVLDLTTPDPAPTAPRQHRPDVVALLHDFTHSPLSQRQFAEQHGVPRSTLQHWLARKEGLDADPFVSAFFESPQGLAFLHRLVVALHLVFTQQGPCGVRLISQFLRLTRLDRLVPASTGSQHAVSAAVTRAVVTFGRRQRQRLGAAMVPVTITVCQDETFHPQVCLVAIEPVSNFLLVERYAANRDAVTWTGAMAEALQGLPVTVVQAVGDEAKALAAHARDGLGVPHGPDLFHVQYEVSGGTSAALAGQVRRAQQELARAQAHTAGLRAAQAKAQGQPRPPGRPVDHALWVGIAERQERGAGAQVAAAQGRQERMREAIRGLGTDYHPFDLATGAPRSAEQVRECLEARFAAIEQIATEAGLPEYGRARIAKARRVVEGLVAAVAFFWVRVRARVAGWPTRLAWTWTRTLLAGAYLRRVAGQASGAEARAALRGVAEACERRACRPPGVTVAVWEEAVGAARESAGWFVRSSSCVEGRNGQLELRHHSLHRLSDQKLAALTVIHNYWIKRSDGTTAAERFFGRKPGDLFGWLLDEIEVPARPAKRRNQAA